MRKREIAKITRNLDAGANIQIVAPRRVGKSSILHYFLDNPIPGHVFMYIDVESVRTKQEYYRKICKEVLKNPVLNERKNLVQQISEGASRFLKKLKSIKAPGLGEIVLSDTSDDYEEELQNLLLGIDLAGDKLVIMIDEFPEVLLNMVEDAGGEPGPARSFLQSVRAFRNDTGIRDKVRFIYAGSNSLTITVENLQSTELINDLTSVSVE